MSRYVRHSDRYVQSMSYRASFQLRFQAGNIEEFLGSIYVENVHQRTPKKQERPAHLQISPRSMTFGVPRYLNCECVKRHGAHSTRTSELDLQRGEESCSEEIFAAEFPEPLDASVASDGRCMFCESRDVADASRESRNPEVFIIPLSEKKRLSVQRPHPCPLEFGQVVHCLHDLLANLKNSRVRPVALPQRQSADSATHNEGRSFAIVPHHKVPVCHLTVPHFCAERRSDRAVRIVYMGIAALGIDLLNPRASSQRSARLQRVGV
jgi:hypothetical protein